MWETILQYWWVILIILIVPPIIKGLNSPKMPKQQPNPPSKRSFAKAAGDYSTDEIIALARINKIEAIKLYRQKTGLGLKEAMDAIELLLAQDSRTNEG